MAMRLEDPDERIAALAQLFFHELAKKEYKVGGSRFSNGWVDAQDRQEEKQRVWLLKSAVLD